MTEGYPPAWQQDVAADPFTDQGRHDAAISGTYDTATTYDTTTTPTYAVTNADGDGSATVTSADDDDSGQGKAGAVKEQAAAVGQGAAQAGQQVASVAKDQAHNVAAEAGSQAKDLLGQTKSELTVQAGAQQKRLIETLRALGDELESMGHHSEQPGMATDLVKQASTRAHDAASWLDSREPGSLLSELQSFARQRPAAFLALAAGAGVVAGRLGRGVKDASSDDAPSTSSGAGSSPSTYDPSAPGNADTSVGTGEARPFASSQDGFVNEAGYNIDAGYRTADPSGAGL